MSQRIWNIGIIDMVCIVLLCFLYFILYEGAHGDVFIQNLALVLMFFCAVVILSTTASLLHAMIYTIPGYREPNFGVSYYNRRRQELHDHIKVRCCERFRMFRFAKTIYKYKIITWVYMSNIKL
jgi:hypothetical protein